MLITIKEQICNRPLTIAVNVLTENVDFSTMIKAFAVAVSGVLAGSAALAGPYVNVENNGSYVDGFQGSVTDIHLGYEGGDGVYGFYAQGGFALVDDTDDMSTELSGKVGASVTVADSGFNLYGEFSGITTDDEPAFGTKVGAKYAF